MSYVTYNLVISYYFQLVLEMDKMRLVRWWDRREVLTVLTLIASVHGGLYVLL